MKNEKSLISIIIPCFNYGNYLGEAIESALKNRRGNFELDIITVDDGSLDNTCEVAKSYGDKVRYVYQENRGLSAARNTGLNNARGDYIIFLDADDMLGESVLEAHFNNFHENPDANISVCNCVLSYPDTRKYARWPIKTDHLDLHICHSNIAPVHSFMIKKTAEDAGLFDVNLNACEDYDFWLRCMARGHKAKFVDKGCAIYRQHENSMSTQKPQQKGADMLVRSKIEKMLETLPDFPVAGKYYGWLAYATGCVTSAHGLLNVSENLARRNIAKGVESLLKAAAIRPKTPPAAPHLVYSERYYLGEFFLAAVALGADKYPELKKGMGFIASHNPNIAQKPFANLEKWVRQQHSYLIGQN